MCYIPCVFLQGKPACGCRAPRMQAGEEATLSRCSGEHACGGGTRRIPDLPEGSAPQPLLQSFCDTAILCL